MITKKQKRSQKDIARAVERYVKGEDVATLCREYGVSRAGFYLWVNKAKAAATAAARVAEIGEKGVEQEAMIALRLENKALREDNERLKRALFDRMVKHGEL